MNAPFIADAEPAPIEMDSRPCAWCCFTIDRHEMIDDGDGPLFFCADILPDEMTLPELERRAELIRQLEVAAILARMDAMNGPYECPPPRKPEPYRPAQSTVDAFLHLARHDPERLPGWLANHPQDAPELFKIWKAKKP